MRSSSCFLGSCLLFTTFAFACTGPDRLFIDPAGTGGAGGAGSTSTTGGGEGGGPTATLEISVPPGNVILREGSTVVVEVSVVRTGTASEPTTITVGQLPAGVTADPLEIAPEATAGQLTLHGEPTALQGIANVAVTGAADGLQAMTSFDLVVAGDPGTPDETFGDGTGSPFQTMVGGLGTRGRGLAIQPDGKIVVAGISAFGSGQAFTLRLTALGAPDAGFGSSGVVSTGIGGGSGGMTVAVDPSGRLIVGGFGELDFDGNGKLALIALMPNGDLDGTFGTGGTVTSSNGSGVGIALAVFPTASEITAVGSFTNVVNATHAILFGYDLQGVQTSSFVDNDQTVQAAARQADGKILVAGRTFSDIFLSRFVDVQTPDPSFSGAGTAFVSFPNRPGIATGLALMPGGQILLGAVTEDTGGADPRLALARLNSNGSLDLSFGSAGTALSNVPMRSRATGSIVQDSQGRILFGGNVGEANRQPAVARFLPDGSPDLTFGPDGTGFVVLDQFPLEPDNTAMGVWGIAVDDLDRVVVSGEVGPSATPSLFVARLWF